MKKIFCIVLCLAFFTSVYPKDKDSKFYYNSGTTKADKGDYLGAIKDYNKAIELNPKFAIAYYNRGVAEVYLSNYEDAGKDLNKAIALNPRNPKAYINRALIKSRQGDNKGAIKDCNKAIALKPDHSAAADAYNNRGIAKYFLGFNTGAIKDCGRAIELNPKLPDAHYYRGMAEEALKKYKSAMEDYKISDKLGFEKAANKIKELNIKMHK